MSTYYRSTLKHYAPFLLIAISFGFALEIFQSLTSHFSYNFELQFENIPLLIGLISVVFVAGFLPHIFYRIIGESRAFWISTLIIGIARLGLQLSEDPMVELGLSIAGTISFLYLLPLLFHSLPSENHGFLPVAMVVGTAGVTEIRDLLETYNLIWLENGGGVLFVAALVLLQFLALKYTLPKSTILKPLKNSLPVLGWGFIIFLNELLFQNIPFVSIITDWTLEGAFVVITVGNAISLAGLFFLYKNFSCRGGLVSVMGLGFILLVAMLPHGWLAVPAIWGGQFFLAIAVVALFARDHDNDTTHCSRSLLRTTIFTSLSFVGLGTFLNLYYLSYLIPLPIDNGLLPIAAAIVIVLCVMVGWQSKILPPLIEIKYAKRIIIFGGCLLIFPPVWTITSMPHTEPQVLPEKVNDIRVMTYNLHNGFSVSGRSSMVTLSEIISESGADVVAMQEVARGWYVDGGIDMFIWLKRQLPDLPYAVFIPAADIQWGMAVFSRFPISNYEVKDLPLDLAVMHRRFVHVEVDAGGKRIPFIATHLHHLSGEEHSSRRSQQIERLLEYAQQTPTLLIMGDMNARPEDPETKLFFDAGWISVEESAGIPLIETYIYSDIIPSTKIDWIFTRPDVIASDIVSKASTASDHLSLTATITLPDENNESSD